MKLPIARYALSSLVALAVILPARGDETAVRQRVEQRVPGLKIEHVTKTAYPGLYEVYAGGALIYVDEQVTYLIQGALIDGKTRQNVSNERMRQLTAITFDQLPHEQAIKIVKGDGQRRLAVFEDPDCPYCRLLERELEKLDNVTIYIFLYPIEQLHPGATEKSRKIWCAEDRAKAWQAAVQKGVVADNPGKCETPLDKLAELGRRLRISGTPTLIFSDGNRIAGTIPAANIDQLLGPSGKAAAPVAPEKPAM